MIPLDDLETPALLVDLERMERNLERGAQYARAHGIALRPHIKTHKSPVLARRQLDLGAAGLTCATPQEAAVMSEVCGDLLVMYPPVGPQRSARLAELARRTRLTVALDSVEAAQDLSRAAGAADSDVQVLVEIDAGMRRVGVPSPTDAATLGRRVAGMPRLRVAGFAFYPGHIRGPVSEHGPQIAALAKLVGATRDAFERQGLPVDVVSAGSTPTFWTAHRVPGLTEMRPGTYIFNDRTTAEIGACALEDCALTVLATVVSTAVPGQAVVDAGAKALGREPMRTSGDGFGCLADDPTVVVKGMSEEHGILDLSRGARRVRVGERVRIVPNHVCIVVHLADVVYGVRGGGAVMSWPVAARGRGLPALAPDPSEPELLRTGSGR